MGLPSARAITSSKYIITSTPGPKSQALILVAESFKNSGALELELTMRHSNISIELFLLYAWSLVSLMPIHKSSTNKQLHYTGIKTRTCK